MRGGGLGIESKATTDATMSRAISGAEDNQLHGAERVTDQRRMIEVKRIDHGGDVLSQAVNGEAGRRDTRAPRSTPRDAIHVKVSREARRQIVVDIALGRQEAALLLRRSVG